MSTSPIANVFAEAIINNLDWRIEEKRSPNSQHVPGTGTTSELVCYIAHHKNGKRALVSWGGRCPGWLVSRAVGFTPWPKPTLPRAKNGRFVKQEVK